MNQLAILSTAYLAPIQYFSKLKNYEKCIIEHHEHFQKQTYRSRCDIYSPNGPLTLSIPLVKRNHRQAVKDIRISYDHDWQKLHWRSLESCYRCSPFFEYYEDDFLPFYTDKKFEFLIDLNESLNLEIFKLLKLKPNYSFSSEYHETYTDADDLRNIISPKESLNKDPLFTATTYIQVFGSKHGFLPNLSIVDLLFNQGSESLATL